MSLSRLASLSGLGKGTLSELERGQRNPTLDTLFAVTTVLNAPLGALLVDDVAVNHPVSANPASGASVYARLLHSTQELDRVLEVYLIEVKAAIQMSQAHQPRVRETLTVLTGTLRAGHPTSGTILRAGETLSYDGDRDHLFEGVGGTATAVLIMDYPRGP